MSFVSSQGGTPKKKTQKKNIRKKVQDVLFLEKQVFQFCLLSVWELLRFIPLESDKPTVNTFSRKKQKKPILELKNKIKNCKNTMELMYRTCI